MQWIGISARKAKWIAGLAASCLFHAGCATRENDTLGVDLLGDQATEKAVRTHTVSPPDSSVDFQQTSLSSTFGQAPTLLVGRETGALARTLVRFDVAGLPDSGQASTLSNAALRIYFDEGIGDLPTVVAAIHRVTATWEESLVSADSLFPAIEAAFDTAAFVTQASGDSTDIPITDLVRFWIDRQDSAFGVALVPVESSNGFLEMFSTEGTTLPKLVATWNTGSSDTTAFLSPTHDTSMLTANSSYVLLTDEAGRVTIARGFPARFLVKFTLPELGPRATINRAELTLYTDLAKSRLHDFTMGVQRVTADPWNGFSTSFDTFFDGGTTITATSDSVVMAITTTVAEQLLSGNFGMIVRSSTETADLEHVRFHAHDSEVPERRPKLKLWTTSGDAVEVQP